MKKFSLACLLALFTLTHSSPEAFACPKRFKLIKAVGRAAKTGITKVAGGVLSFTNKIASKVKD